MRAGRQRGEAGRGPGPRGWLEKFAPGPAGAEAEEAGLGDTRQEPGAQCGGRRNPSETLRPGQCPQPRAPSLSRRPAPGGEEGVPRCRGSERPSRIEVSRRDLRPGAPGLGGGSRVRFSHGFPARPPGRPAHRDVDLGGRAHHISIAHSRQVIHSGD